jgi:hypothetical protein
VQDTIDREERVPRKNEEEDGRSGPQEWIHRPKRCDLASQNEIVGVCRTPEHVTNYNEPRRAQECQSRITATATTPTTASATHNRDRQVNSGSHPIATTRLNRKTGTTGTNHC